MMLHDDLRDGKSQYKVPEVSWLVTLQRGLCRVESAGEESALEGFEQERHKPHFAWRSPFSPWAGKRAGAGRWAKRWLTLPK